MIRPWINVFLIFIEIQNSTEKLLSLLSLSDLACDDLVLLGVLHLRDSSLQHWSVCSNLIAALLIIMDTKRGSVQPAVSI